MCDNHNDNIATAISSVLPDKCVRRAIARLRQSHPHLHSLLNRTINVEPMMYVFKGSFPPAAVVSYGDDVGIGVPKELTDQFKDGMSHGLPLEVVLYLLLVVTFADLASRPEGSTETITDNQQAARQGLKAGSDVFADCPRRERNAILRVLRSTGDSAILRRLNQRHAREGSYNAARERLKRRLFQLEWMVVDLTSIKPTFMQTRREKDMSLAEVLWRVKLLIVQNTHLCIVHGMLDTWSRCAQQETTPSEPDFVAGLVIESAPRLYQAYKAILNPYGIQVSLAAVFCHQTPKVKFAGMRRTSCEVGDLLIVHIHRYLDGLISRNALLYQAKMTSRQPLKLHSSEIDQLNLYKGWPDFEYHNSPPLRGQRKVTPKSAHPGAKYMLIDNRSQSDLQTCLTTISDTCPIGCCMPNQALCSHNHLAAEMFDFLCLRSGRAFTDRSSSLQTKGWSRVVWDLLDIGLRKVFNRRNCGRSSIPRYAGGPLDLSDSCYFAAATKHTVMMAATEIFGHDDAAALYLNSDNFPPNEGPSRGDENERGTGVSLLVIEMDESKEE